MTDDVTVARARSALARARLTAGLDALKQRVMPQRIARRLATSFNAKAGDATTAVRTRPALAIGLAALTALLLARKPILRAIKPETPATPSPQPRSTAKRHRKAKP